MIFDISLLFSRHKIRLNPRHPMIIFGFIIRNQSFDICPLEWHPLFYDILRDDVDLNDFQIQTISKLKKLITYLIVHGTPVEGIFLKNCFEMHPMKKMILQKTMEIKFLQKQTKNINLM